MLRDAERTFLNVARPARGHNCLANGSKGPLNGSPLQIKVQMLRDRHLVLREPWLVMGGWFEEAQMFEGAHTHIHTYCRWKELASQRNGHLHIEEHSLSRGLGTCFKNVVKIESRAKCHFQNRVIH